LDGQISALKADSLTSPLIVTVTVTVITVSSAGAVPGQYLSTPMVRLMLVGHL